LVLLRNKGVYVHPGHFYNFPAEGCLVVSLIANAAQFADGVHGLLWVF
jgi:hypothetical protein